MLFATEFTVPRTSPWPADRLLLVLTPAMVRRGVADEGCGPAGQRTTATSAKDVATALAPVRPDLPAVRGTPSTAEAFSAAWTEVAGARVTPSFEETLYRLKDFVAPGGGVGEPRLAGADDADLPVGWLDAFFVEAFESDSNPEGSRGLLAEIDAGGHVVLGTVNGEPAAMARVHGCLLGMSRIGPVYMPPESMGRGCGATVTAEAVRHAQRHGARDVVLHADVADPGSNRIDRQLGFVPVAESVQYIFAA